MRTRGREQNLAGGFALALVCCGCGVRTLPPREAPSKEVTPDVISPGPPKHGTGRLLLDTPDGHVRVDVMSEVNERLSWAMTRSATIGNTVYETWELKPDSDVVLTPLCMTPCIVDLPPGEYVLRYQTLAPDEIHSDVERMTVTTEPTVHRRAVGRSTRSQDAFLAFFLPPLMWVPGLVFGGVAVSNAVTAVDAEGARADKLRGTSIGFGIAGAVFLAAGIVAGYWIRPLEQEGATTRFPLNERR
jgi:hypothetical protein